MSSAAAAAPFVHRSADARPRRTGVVGPVDAARISFDQRPHTIGIHGRHRDADVAKDSGWKAGVPADVGPRLTSIRRFVDATSRSARDQHPRSSVSVPCSGVHDFCVRGIDREIDRTCRITDEENFSPGLPAVLGFENTAIGIWPPVMAKRCDVNNVGILWINSDPADLPCICKSNIAPRFAGISGFENAVTVRDVSRRAKISRAIYAGSSSSPLSIPSFSSR